MSTNLETWALPRLLQLLPLDEDSLKQIITYSDTLPKDRTAEHLKNLLGDSSQALEFISSFNTRRQPPPSANPPPPVQNNPAARAESEAPRSRPRQQKKKANIHSLPARQIDSSGQVQGGYVKRNEDDYMAARHKPATSKGPALANTLALDDKPVATQLPVPTSSGTSNSRSLRPPPSASGPLISDSLSPSTSAKSSRTSSPAPSKTKITIQGGQAMHGASSALSDLDSAIRSLEIQTNPTLSTNSPEDLSKRRCPCMATRHPLLAMAPNCLKCGHIVCVKEGLGPCTFCSTPLLSPDDLASMLRVLKDERGKERQTINNSTHKRAEISTKPKAFSGRDFLSSTSAASSGLATNNTPTLTSSSADAAAASTEDDILSKAKSHRDRLLAFQAQNAKRTQIHDEAADYDVPVSGTSMWASPTERALQLKKQQKVLRENDWNARPEWEKKRVVASLDVVGGKVVRRMKQVEREREPEDDDSVDVHDEGFGEEGMGSKDVEKKISGGGAFSRNPLLGALIRPVARDERDRTGGGEEREKKSVWRRVQDDRDDNEAVILDGGAYGGRGIDGRVLGSEERAVGVGA